MNNILFLLMLSIHFVRADVDSDDFEAVDRFKRYYYYPLRYGYYPIVSSGLPSINAYKKYRAYDGNRHEERSIMHANFSCQDLLYSSRQSSYRKANILPSGHSSFRSFGWVCVHHETPKITLFIGVAMAKLLFLLLLIAAMAIFATENNAQPSAESFRKGSVPVGKLKRLRPKRYYPYYYGHGWWPGYYSSWYSPWYGDSWGWWWW